MIPDVLIVGGGPAGRALAAETAVRGLRTTLIDPAPDAAWKRTYGTWADDLPPELPATVVASRSRGRAIARTEHRLGWDYAVLDVPALRAHLDGAMVRSGVDVRVGRAVGPAGDGAVVLADGSTVRARLVVDAGGAVQPLAVARRVATRRRVAAEQRAYGVVVDQTAAASLVAPGEALFMDWRPDHGGSGHPTFLYAVPYGNGRVLLEETSLARRPGLPLRELRRRLLHRLAGHGIAPPSDAAYEVVVIPLDVDRHRAPGILGFGAATPLVHPASGFSLSTTLTLAPLVAHALATRLPGGVDPALAAARAVLWPAVARAVHRFRRIGLESLLRMPPEQVPDFFEVFFALPERRRWSYLTGRDDLRGTMAVMAALFARSDAALRLRLVIPAVLPPAPAVGWPGPV